ncbi:amidase family protein [Marinomonas gallaica]|uniref:amidase family protein n=1 Tax=Marinomonas gallaica TaxID=1806667 RepID=UPI0009ED7A71|nr:amidase family protein [Marinomonas gallaica]MCO4785846.1 amidase [Marinomonas atlantica]
MIDHKAWCNRDLTEHLNAVSNDITENRDAVFIAPFIEVADIKNKPLSGAVVSIKATFDVKGHSSSGGTTLLKDRPAQQDAHAVALLRAAGASLIGHTNMTELAYSGVGLNPHYGTPNNPVVPGCIPGGSTSGGAVTVAKGMADIALGTDTGGSLRIPAAFCGLTGFKPSQSSVSRVGCLPLSDSLDSVGVMARNVETCELAWNVLTSNKASQQADAPLTLVVPKNFGFDDLDKDITDGFKVALDHLKSHGVVVQHCDLSLFETYKALPVWQFSAVESRRYYKQLFSLEDGQLDPRVKQRIKRGEGVSEQVFMETCAQRSALITRFQSEHANTVFLMPTVACLPPKFDQFESDENFDRINLLCLRNTTFANVIDGCSISLPYSFNSNVMGLMLTAMNGKDQSLLKLAKVIETALS